MYLWYFAFVIAKILIAILLAAFIVRIVGIGYGLPQQFVADEFLMVAVSLKMLETKSLTPNFPDIFYHQPLTAYISVFGIGGYLAWQLLTGVFSSVAEMRDFYQVNSADLLIVVRFLSVLFGVGTAWLLYLIGRDLFNKRVGLLAAFFGAFELLSVQFNHTGRVWGFLPFFVALALWASVKVFTADRMKNYIKSALASVAALATLLPGIFTFIPTVIASFYSHGRIRIAEGQRPEARYSDAKKLWLAALIVFLGLIGSLYLNPRGLGVLLLRFGIGNEALTQAVFNAPVDTAALSIGESWFERVSDPFITLFNYLPVYFILFFAGLIILWKEDRRKFILLSSFPLAYYLFIGPFFSYGWVARTLLPIAVYCVLVSAFVIDRILSKNLFTQRKLLVPLLVAAISSYSIYFSVLFDIKISRADTRTQAIDWIYQNLKGDSRIMAFSVSNDTINQNRKALEKMKEAAPDKMNTRQRFLLTADDSAYPRPRYFAWDLRKVSIGELPDNFFKKNDFRYYYRVRWGTEGSDYFDNLIEGQFAEKKLLAEFKPFSGEKDFKNNFANNIRNPAKVLLSVDRFGPIVEIYEVKFK